MIASLVSAMAGADVDALATPEPASAIWMVGEVFVVFCATLTGLVRLAKAKA